MDFISASSLKEQIENNQSVFILDIRENYEREASSIPSHHIPMADVCSQLDLLPKNEAVIIMCNSGKRAEALANLLEKEYNQQNLIILEGGISAWIEQFGQQ
jgi:rhodanese-related sulfurtransferase